VLAAVPLASAGALVNAELLGKAMRRGFRIREVAVTHRPRRHGRATGGRLRVAWQALRELAVQAPCIRGGGPAAPASARDRPLPAPLARHPAAG
jgi:hypothetical protein